MRILSFSYASVYEHEFTLPLETEATLCEATTEKLNQFRYAGLPCFLPHAPLPVRVPAEVTNQMLALVRNVLRHFGQEVQDADCYQH